MLWKKPLDNELLKSVKAVGEIRGAQILYINTGTSMRSVDLFFCLRIRLTISSLSERGRGCEADKLIFYGAHRKFNEEIFERGILRARLEQCLENSC